MVYVCIPCNGLEHALKVAGVILASGQVDSAKVGTINGVAYVIHKKG
jgi:hypothetical protein